MRAHEARSWRLMAARLKSARGVVMLEFGVFAPIVLLAILVASDFLHVLCCEQQLEIVCRALCDIEAHLKPGKRTNASTPTDLSKYSLGQSFKYDVSGCPGQPGQLVAMHYLEEAIGKDSNVQMLRYYGGNAHGIYPRGYFYMPPGPMHDTLVFFEDIEGHMKKVINDSDLGWFMKEFFNICMCIFQSAIDFLTLRTDRYVTDILSRDKVVAVSLSAEVMPTYGGAGLFLREASLSSSKASVIPMYTRDWDVTTSLRRKRFYYHMPSFDTVPLAPETYARHMAKPFSKWIPEE